MLSRLCTWMKTLELKYLESFLKYNKSWYHIMVLCIYFYYCDNLRLKTTKTLSEMSSFILFFLHTVPYYFLLLWEKTRYLILKTTFKPEARSIGYGLCTPKHTVKGFTVRFLLCIFIDGEGPILSKTQIFNPQICLHIWYHLVPTLLLQKGSKSYWVENVSPEIGNLSK